MPTAPHMPVVIRSGYWWVISGNEQKTETGIVHTAPAFGADDYKVGKKYGIGILYHDDRKENFVDGLVVQQPVRKEL